MISRAWRVVLDVVKFAAFFVEQAWTCFTLAVCKQFAVLRINSVSELGVIASVLFFVPRFRDPVYYMTGHK